MERGTDQRKWRHTRLGSVLLSYDFYVGIPVGILAGVAVAFSSSARGSASGLLIGVAGVSAAVAALVLTSLTVLLTTLSSEYRSLLAQVPGGVLGVARPYRIIVAVAASGTVASLLASFLMPALEGRVVIGRVHVAAWVLTSASIALCMWATLGCVQLTSQLLYHWRTSMRVEDIERRRRSLSNVG